MNSTHQYSGRYYEPDAGAYGRDGAPAQNFMSALAPVHRLPSPQRANVAPSERPLPPMDRLAPQPHRGYQAPPSYAPEHPFVSPLDPQLPVPKAAFLEPASPTSHSFESHSSHGLIHGESEKSPSREDFYHPGARWKDLERAKQQGSSVWLQKQSQAGVKFKTVTWVIAVIALVIIAGLLAKIVTKKSPPVTSPAPLKWANGATHVPTFGANSTTAAVPTDSSKSPKSDSTLPNTSGASSKTASAKRHLVSLD